MTTCVSDGAPLAGIKVIEVGGIGPVPMAGMLLADLGADIVRVERPAEEVDQDYLLRNRPRVSVDLKDMAQRDTMLRLIGRADVLIEGFRPGVMERLGLGPDVCARHNPRLVYGRMTGYGQHGPRSLDAGHDINYVSLTGMLFAFGSPNEPPFPPLNLLGDFGGGAMFLVTGVLAALLERTASHRGQVVDAAIIDGTSLLGQMIWSWRAIGRWNDRRRDNLLDGAAPFYTTYQCADGRYLAVGALEDDFYETFVSGLGLSADSLHDRKDPSTWPSLRSRFAAVIGSRTRDEWAARFAGTDACVTPVLTFDEVPADPQVAARGSVSKADGVVLAGTAPSFSRSVLRRTLDRCDHDTTLAEVVARWLPGRDG